MEQETGDLHISLNDSNVLKGLAICAMLWHHLFYETAQYGLLIQELGVACKVCVSMFLFISGYGLTIQYSKNRNINQCFVKIRFTALFLCRRLIKFYSNYWIIFFILVITGTNIFGRSLSVAYGPESIFTSIIKDFFGLQGIDSYIPTWWFNELIICLYLLFPFLFWFMKRVSIAFGFLLLLFLWPREWIIDNFFYIFEMWNPSLVIYTPAFAIGIFFAQHESAINKILKKIKSHWIFTISILLTAILFYCRHVVEESFVDAISLDAFISLFISITVVSLCKALQSKFICLELLGKHSMNMYLSHTFILMFLFPTFLFKQSPFIIFPLLLVESLCFSILIEFLKNKIGFYKLLIFITQPFSR